MLLGNLTVQGTTTTLDTILTEVDKLEVGANNSTVGVAITQSGSGDILNLYDGSTQVVTVKDGGNVGIGTDDPGAKLHLYSAGPQARWTDSDNDSDSRIRYNGSLFIFEADSFNEIADSAFSFRVDGANIANEKLRIDSSGNVGIGTDNPTQKLELLSTGNTIVKLGGASANTTGIIINRGGSEVSRIAHSNSDDLSFYTTSSVTERLRITSDGKVRVPDNNKLTLGDGDDLQIEHKSNGDSVIAEAGTGALYIGGNEVRISPTYSTQFMGRFVSGAEVALYYNYSKKFETKSDGVDVTGEVQLTH